MNAVVMRLCAAVVLALAPLASSAQPVELEGVKLEPGALVGGANRVLNGAGVRTREIFKVYVAGLYVPQKSNSATALLAQKGQRRIAITMLRTVDAETFSGALSEGLQKNLSAAQFAGFKAQKTTVKGVGLCGAMADLVPPHVIAEVTDLLRAPYVNNFG